MRLDRALLDQHSSFTADGITERAFHIDVGGDRCFAVLDLPAEPADLGFVVCHSYALELLTLRRTERAVARALAGLGHPVLTFHRRGFGDSDGELSDATLERQLDDTRAAMEHMERETSIDRLGLIGMRFGGLIAGLVAHGGGVERLILANPALSGRAYFRGLIRDVRAVKLAEGGASGSEAAQEVPRALERESVADLLGHPLHSHLFEAASAVNLAEDVGAFRGDALVVVAAKRQSPPKDVETFRAAVESRGGTCAVELVKEPPGAVFGTAAFVSVAHPSVRIDVQAPMVADVAGAVTSWMSNG